MQTDCIQPFLFEHLDIRGALVTLDETWRNLCAGRDYPANVAQTLGEMSAVTTLIAANLKQPGRMTFQLRGDGAINLLVLDCDEQLRLRGMARWDAESLRQDTPLPALLGDGQLLLSLDSAAMRQPYQSFVPMEGDNIAAIFEHYLTLSEQQPTRLVLAADERRAVGMLLQKMPDSDHHDADGWNRIQHLLGTLKADEQLAHAPLELLRRLFPEEEVRVFAPRPVSHHCPEDREKIHAMLRSLGREECDAVLREHGVVHVRDDICNRDYSFTAAELDELFDAPARRMH
ncbi:MAG: molecular chaperone Hsp33 [Hydrogenophilales bacterium 28-61-23]|nr:MAG: molecular chaperone Hsp33 [Hydrogenophilales bacterium 28-61-23]